IPSEYRSDRRVAGSPRHSSGAMYSGVPTRHPGLGDPPPRPAPLYVNVSPIDQRTSGDSGDSVDSIAASGVRALSTRSSGGATAGSSNTEPSTTLASPKSSSFARPSSVQS